MNAGHRVLRERRQYNKWASSQTLEDYALRYTPADARRWSAFAIGGTAIGATSFLACEAIGASITLSYGFANSAAAIAAAIVLMFLLGLPIAYYAAKQGLDIDLLTRGAGFGYLGSTITSLIYASFTFLLFAIEASIMSAALSLVLGIPIAIAHVLSALVVIPIALYGMRAITRMQLATQPIWLLLQLIPIVYLLVHEASGLPSWAAYSGQLGARDGSVTLPLFGLALSTLLSLLPQIGEQADYLRFLPPQEKVGRLRWWVALVSGGPGWVLFAGIKLMLGSALAVFALSHGLGQSAASDPTDMYHLVFRHITDSPAAALALTGLLVVVCQMKINVTNAYAGSLAWSNFFSRLTYAHPGRVVWLVFNVMLALLLMEAGVLGAIGAILILYANLAAGWIGALSADLIVSKPLGLSPPGIEFKRAHLYDINPVGVGAMGLSILVSTAAMFGLFGETGQGFSPILGLSTAFVAAPVIAFATRSRFYLARSPALPEGAEALTCTICEHPFERPDMAFCPAYAAPICSLCCTLEARCRDMCKQESRFGEQLTSLLSRVVPARLTPLLHNTTGHFLALLTGFAFALGLILYLIYFQYGALAPDERPVIATTLWAVFFALLFFCGIAAWLLVLAHDSRRAAERESALQTGMLQQEVAAHVRTDAALKEAKEAAEAANAAKSRYLVGVSHEIRSPLNAIYGYSQLLERGGSIDAKEAGSVIRRSSEHLTNLVDGLLDISRIESGVLKLRSDIVPFPALLEQLADMFRMQAQAKGIGFQYSHSGPLPQFVRTDEKRLRQILINLLSNAVKYTSTGHAALHVRYRSQIAQIEVSDTGIGIEPDEIERIFEPFERGGTSAARAQPGTGLGLAITRVLAQIMGGDVNVTSVPGEGSRFTLRLMLPEPAQRPADTARLRSISGYHGPPRTILIVDDDPAQIVVLQGLLKPLGFDVFVASNGAAGLELAALCKPDLVLLDIQMPAMSGWEVAERLRAAGGPRLKIVMVSANAHEFTAGGDGGSAHDAFVMKPVELEMLLDVLAANLGLSWIIGKKDGAQQEPEGPLDPVPGAEPYIAELRRLGKIGHVRAISATLDEFERELPAAKSLVARLRSQVKAFDLKNYLKQLEAQDGGH